MQSGILRYIRFECFSHCTTLVEQSERKLDVDAGKFYRIAWPVEASMIGGPSLRGAMEYFNSLVVSGDEDILFNGRTVTIEGELFAAVVSFCGV
jgi:hypothetical protein